MEICEIKLIQGLAKNVEELSRFAHDAQGQSLIKSTQTILSELHRRADFSAMYKYYEQGRSLVTAARAALPSHLRHKQSLDLAIEQSPERLRPDLCASAVGEYLDNIRRAIWAILDGSGYPSVNDAPLKTLLKKLSDWEDEGYRLDTFKTPDMAENEKSVSLDGTLLEHYLRTRVSGYEKARVISWNPVPGGFSKQTVLFEVENGSGVESFVYRGTNRIQIIERVLVDIAAEFYTVKYAYAQGAAIAEPIWLQSDAQATGARFFISRRVPGINLGTAVQAHKEITFEATRSLANSLAKIHGLELDPSGEALAQSHIRPLGSGFSLQQAILNRVNDWYAYFRALDCDSYPRMELAFQWLRENVPAPDGDTPVLVHGDYGLHNILVHADEVTAVLDWEACHLGDRALDLSHILTGTAGKMDRERFMETYISAGGRPVSEFRLRYFQVLMAAQFMLSTIDAQIIFQNRAGASTNYCILGLGFIRHTATTIIKGIENAEAAR